jgi:peptidyl-prolyl cis-trans isomerase D
MGKDYLAPGIAKPCGPGVVSIERPEMLEFFRNAAKGWIAKIFLLLLVGSFSIWGVSSRMSDLIGTMFGAVDLATVGGTKLSSETFRQELKRTMDGISRQQGAPISMADVQKAGIDQQVLDRLLAQASVDATTKRLDLAVGEQAVKNIITTNPGFKGADGKFDINVMRSVLAQNNLSEQGFVEGQKRDQLRASMVATAGDNTVLPKAVTEAMLRYKNETRDARYVTFTVSASDLPQPTEEDLKKQYESAPAAYTAPEYRSIAVLSVMPADIAAKIQVTDEDLKVGYEKFKEDFHTLEKRTIIQLSFPSVDAATAAKARIDKGEDILKIAAELKQKESDITFADKTRDEFLDQKIADAAFALKEGEVSTPVKGSLNTALLKALKVNPEKQSTLDEVKDELRKKVQLDKASEQLQPIYDAVEDARASSTRFEDIAAKLGIPVTVIPAISADGRDKSGKDVSLPAREEVLKAVYGSDVGVENDALTAGDGYVWYDVREVVPSAVKSIANVKEQVKADWSAAKMRTLASDKAKAILAKAGTTTAIGTIATELAQPIKTANAVTRNQTTEAFDGVATLALFSAPEKTLTWALEADGQSARIIEVSKINIPPFDGASADAKSLDEQMRKGLSADMNEAFIKAMREGAKVVLNDKLWADIRGGTAPQ